MTIDPVNPAIIYEYFHSPSPSETAGKYEGMTFYLYARWSHWDFTLCPVKGIDAELIGDFGSYDLNATQKSEKPFPDAWIQAFKQSYHREGVFPEAYQGSYLSNDEMMNLVRSQILEYENQLPRLGYVPTS